MELRDDFGSSVDDRLAKFGLVEEEVALPSAASVNNERQLSKGKSSFDYYDTDCVPLYPTPAPTKGKGKGSKGFRDRELAKGSKGKGKGKSVSAAPVSFMHLWILFCYAHFASRADFSFHAVVPP